MGETEGKDMPQVTDGSASIATYDEPQPGGQPPVSPAGDGPPPPVPAVDPPDRLRLSLDLPRQPSAAQYAQIVRQFARDIAALPPALAGIAPFQREQLGLAVEAALYAELKQLGV